MNSHELKLRFNFHDTMTVSTGCADFHIMVIAAKKKLFKKNPHKIRPVNVSIHSIIALLIRVGFINVKGH